MGKRKIRKGALITSFDQLMKCDWIIIGYGKNGDKPLSRRWWSSWQINMAMNFISNKHLHEGIRLTNGEYYEGVDEEKLLEKFGDEIRAEGFEKWKEKSVA